MMLELLMTRQDELDRRVIGNCAGLRFLVLDELHTYRGRQGADVALLVRRVRERLSPEKLHCIGTSATMASEGSLEDKSRVVARVASKLFAIDIPESNVIVETLERVTDSAVTADSVRPQLGAAIDAGISPTITDAALRAHPLAVWVETRLGVSFSEVDQRWVRARPLTVTEAVARARPQRLVATRSAVVSASRAPARLERSRASANAPILGKRTASFFAFKLHQFISGAGHAFATLEPPGTRTVTVGRAAVPPGRSRQAALPGALLPRVRSRVPPGSLRLRRPARVPRSRHRRRCAGAQTTTRRRTVKREHQTGEVFGFLTPHAPDADFTFADRDEDYPETWLEFDAADRHASRATTARPARATLPSRRTVKRAPAPRRGSSQAGFASASVVVPRTARRPATALGSRRCQLFASACSQTLHLRVCTVRCTVRTHGEQS